MDALATAPEVILAGGALLLTVGLGTVAHEFVHAIVLRAFGVPCEVEWFPDESGAGLVRAGFYGRWAAVTPRSIPRELPPWRLRLAAVAPLSLATPMVLVLVGALPDPIQSGNLPLVAATIAWFACALPSPQDFSLFWHAERTIADNAVLDSDADR